MTGSRTLLAATAFAFLATAAPAPAADPSYAAIEPLPGDAAAAELARGARTLVTVGADGRLRAATRGAPAGPADPPVKAEDPAIQAVLRMLGLDRPTSFVLVGVQNPQCVKICELIGGDYICRKVCN